MRWERSGALITALVMSMSAGCASNPSSAPETTAGEPSATTATSTTTALQSTVAPDAGSSTTAATTQAATTQPSTTQPATTQPATTSTTRPTSTTSATETTAGPAVPCDLRLIVEQTDTAFDGITPEQLSCVDGWTGWVGRADDPETSDGYFAVAAWGDGTWTLINLGTSGVCADGGVPQSLWDSLRCPGD
jgi:hypothetical protein